MAATNVNHSVEGDVLTIKVTLGKTFGRSKSGKTEIVGSTGGFIKFEHKGKAYMFNLNVNQK